MPIVQNNNMEFARTHCPPYRMYWGGILSDTIYGKPSIGAQEG